MRHGLEGAGLVLTPDREPKLRPQCVGLLDQLFLAIASGSLTRTTPCLRWAHHHAGFAPGAALLPAQAARVQGAPDRERADPRQPVSLPDQKLDGLEGQPTPAPDPDQLKSYAAADRQQQPNRSCWLSHGHKVSRNPPSPNPESGTLHIGEAASAREVVPPHQLHGVEIGASGQVSRRRMRLW